MSRKVGESGIDFQKRVLDAVSPSFCAAKWLNSTIWLGNGQTASCHHPPPHRVDLRELNSRPSALHNTQHKKHRRAQMLKGERPRECEYCWKIEDAGANVVSDRVYKSDFYNEADLKRIAQQDPSADVLPRTLEIAFDRRCNLACSYCNAGYSTSWGRDIESAGAYRGLVSDGRGAYQHTGEWADPFESRDFNPYVDAFWRWWPEIRDQLIELKITGGEPLMSPHFWRLVEDLRSSKKPAPMLFSINSNLSSRAELIGKFLEVSNCVRKLGLYTSMEARGLQAEYIRDGLDYKLFSDNLERCLESGRLVRLQIMATISVLSLYTITDFIDSVLPLKARFGALFPAVSLTILRFPSFMSPSVLPRELRMERVAYFRKWISSVESSPLLHDFELDTVRRLIDYLENVETPHSLTSELSGRRSDFRAFFEQYDLRRQKSFARTFPKILVDWYRSVQLTDISNLEPLQEGDASDGYHEQDDSI